MQDFQLWRNGEQVRIYTSVSSGTLGASDFIEFWGFMNDGKKDNSLYIKPEYQPSDRYSMETDTASFFLTVNTSGGNLRYVNETNPAPITGQIDQYYIRDFKFYYKAINNGKAIYVPSEYLYSSSYDIGEGVGGTVTTSSHNLNLQGANLLNVYTAGPQTYDFKATVAGASYFTRSVRFLVNNIQIGMDTMPEFTMVRKNVNGLPLSQLNETGANNIKILSTSPLATDRMGIYEIGLKYPAKFIFNNQKNWQFTLEPSATGRNIEITSFNHNKIQPVLYDLTAGKRYIGYLTTTATSAKVQFVLPPSATTNNYVIASLDPSNVLPGQNITARTFNNYMSSENQGNYVIISNKKLDGDQPSASPVLALSLIHI